MVSPLAVSMITGVLALSRIFFSTAQPSSTGSIRSSSTRSGWNAELLHRRAAVAGYLGFVALLLQVEMEQLCDIIVVLYDQNLLGHWVHQPFIFLPYSLL